MPWEDDDPMEEVDYQTFWEVNTWRYVRSVTFMLHHAGEPVTLDNISLFVNRAPRRLSDLCDKMWRDGYCNSIMGLAHKKCHQVDSQLQTDWQFPFEMIANYLPDCGIQTAEMMIQGIIGVVDALSIEPKQAEPKRRSLKFWSK
jgi:hypothetical protein